MMETRLVALNYAHLEALQIDANLRALRLVGPGFCLLAENEPVAAAGVVMFQQHVGMAWVHITLRAKKSPFLMRRIHRYVKQQLPIVFRAMNLEKMIAEANLDEPMHCSWLEYFGFRASGTFRRYAFEG